MSLRLDLNPYLDLLRSVARDPGLTLTERQIEQLATHFALLIHWNRKVNLTSVRRPDEIARRHFEESLFLAKLLTSEMLRRQPLLVDVGSGAGFPGLPLKVARPSLAAVLLEPNRKKCAFLKEVVRSCALADVSVRSERLEQAARGDLAGRASLVTMRAVALTSEVFEDLRKLLAPGGRLALFLGAKDAEAVARAPGFDWHAPIAIPHSERRVILIGASLPRT